MKRTILSFVLILLIYSCHENQPLQTDGKTEIQIQAMWSNPSEDSVQSFIPLSNAEFVLICEYGTTIAYADENGLLSISDLPSSIYQISASQKHPADQNITIVGSINNVEVISGEVRQDTIYAKPISSSGISINEIYAGGPINNIYFCYDQFIELYNSSNEVKYLDGMQVFRLSQTDGVNTPGSDWDYDGDIDGVTYAFKFPGSPGQTNYPFEPQSFLVLASDAYNHKNTVSNSIDLSHADWEFVNQLNAVDIDNPNVPNLSNFRLNKTSDFLIRLDTDRIIITSGVDTVWKNGIDIETILDGVEYRSNRTSIPTMDDRIDRGWVQSPPKYKGKSMQRREKGVDTNDSTLDWEIINTPTPGWH